MGARSCGNASLILATLAKFPYFWLTAFQFYCRQECPSFGKSCLVVNEESERLCIFVCAITLRSLAAPPSDKKTSQIPLRGCLLAR